MTLQSYFQISASRKLKRAVRELSFSNDGEQLFAICENRALCVYNVAVNKRLVIYESGAFECANFMLHSQLK